MKIFWKMEHLLQKSKSSILNNIFKYVIFQMQQKALSWSKGCHPRHFYAPGKEGGRFTFERIHTITIALTFEPVDLELWYFICLYLLERAFQIYKKYTTLICLDIVTKFTKFNIALVFSIVFLKECFEKVNFEKKSDDDKKKKHEKLPSMQSNRDVQCNSFKMLCLGSIGMDYVISEPFL